MGKKETSRGVLFCPEGRNKLEKGKRKGVPREPLGKRTATRNIDMDYMSITLVSDRISLASPVRVVVGVVV